MLMGGRPVIPTFCREGGLASILYHEIDRFT